MCECENGEERKLLMGECKYQEQKQENLEASCHPCYSHPHGTNSASDGKSRR